MKVSEDVIRQLAIDGLKKLGPDAKPEELHKYIERELGGEVNKENVQLPSSAERVILTSFGLNHPGVVSSISSLLSEKNCDILDLSQKIMQEYFTMIILVDISNCPITIKDLQEEMNTIAEKLRIKIYLQHEDVFRFMHRI